MLYSIHAGLIEGVTRQVRFVFIVVDQQRQSVSLLPLCLSRSRIYYEDKDLFITQDNVCAIISKLEDYWDVPCSSFNVLPALKGLFAGPLAYTISLPLNNDDATETWGVRWHGLTSAYTYKTELIVDVSQIASIKTDEHNNPIEWVLVVEKETVFMERMQELNMLRQNDPQGGSPSNLHGTQPGSGVIVTVRSD